jgi:hypothetical protein
MGLFLGATGGAIAAADTDSSGSDTDSSGSTAPGDGDAGGSNQGSTGSSTTSGPVGSITDSLQKTLQGVMSSSGSGQTPESQSSTGAESSTVEPAATDSADENEDSGLVATDPTPVEPVPPVVEPVTNAVEPVTNAVEPVPAVVEPVTNVIEPAPTVDASAPSVVTPVPNLAAPVSTVVNGLAATTTDVIALVEDMLTSAAGAVLAFTGLQSDLSALLGIAAADPALGGVGDHAGVGLSAVADASVLAPSMALQSRVVSLQTGIPGVTWADSLIGVAPVGGGSATTLLSQESPLPEAAPAPDGIIPVGVREFVRQTFDELRRSPALAALLYAALPGVGGLLIVTGAGVRLGYRQAKARLALRTAGIARFARSGPIGVVRSGSLVYVRPRALHVVRPGTLGAGAVLDEAA